MVIDSYLYFLNNETVSKNVIENHDLLGFKDAYQFYKPSWENIPRFANSVELIDYKRIENFDINALYNRHPLPELYISKYKSFCLKTYNREM